MTRSHFVAVFVLVCWSRIKLLYCSAHWFRASVLHAFLSLQNKYYEWNATQFYPIDGQIYGNQAQAHNK